MKEHRLKGSALLLIASVIWGTAFVAQSVGMNHLDAFAFNSIRNFIGVIALIPVLLWQIFQTSESGNDNTAPNRLKSVFTKDLMVGGIICGTALCIASNFQQLGIQYSTVGKSAFITALYIVLVPLLGLFSKKRLPIQIWIGVGLAIVGLYLLCMKGEKLVLSTGDIYLLLCAIFFTIQITAVDYFAPKVNCIALSMMQFFVTAILSGVGMVFTEIPTLDDVFGAAIPLLYAGVLSSGIAFTFQIIGQKHLAPSLASIIMSLESVFATLAGWLILHEVLSTQEILGCGMMFTAVILSQIPSKRD